MFSLPTVFEYIIVLVDLWNIGVLWYRLTTLLLVLEFGVIR